MRKLSRIMISLPLLAAPLVLAIAMPGPAMAEVRNVGPSGALELLAQSRAADAKCKHLTGAEHAELVDYVAKAEVAVAARNGADAARASRQIGKGLGSKMACGRESEELVRATMDAARRAMDAARSETRTRRVVRREPVTRARAVYPTKAVIRNIAPAKGNTGLNGYRAVTAAYYLERRCNHLPRSQSMAFWKSVVAMHKSVLHKYSTSQVAKAKRQAERSARAKGRCGTRTAQIVRRGYANVRNN